MESSERPQLLVSRKRAEEVLHRHVEDGRDLLENAKAVETPDQHAEWGQTTKRWRSLTETALTSIFSTDGPAKEFDANFHAPFVWTSETPWTRFFNWDRKTVEHAINVLLSFIDRLEYLAPPDTSAESGPSRRRQPSAEDGEQRPVFIVHGHDNERKTQVARLLEKTGKHPVTILHEQPNRGRTLIEKFEEYADQSAYGVVLLTADDVGAAADMVTEAVNQGANVASLLESRGRQNVVFELGYFFGLLGRQHVAVLYDEGVELPSDIGGLVYVALDAGGAWQAKLLLELRSAGFDYDLNLLT